MRITAYHGTDANFNRFDFDKIGSVNGTDSGFGFYFTTSKGEAVMYGNNVMTVELNLKKKISNKRVTLSVPVITKLLTNLKNLDYVYIENYDGNIRDAVSALRDYNNSDTEIIGDLINSLTGGKAEIILKQLSKLGYNYTTEDKRLIDDEDAEHYVMFDDSDIRIKSRQSIG